MQVLYYLIILILYSIMASTDNYKKVGIYENNRGERIFLVASSLTELKVYKGRDIITKGYSINENSIILDNVEYNKIVHPDTRFNLLSEKTLGSTKRKIRIGDKIIFKSAEYGNKSLEIILQEISRNLIAISAGIPHALNYGIFKKDDNYYIIEEKVDIDGFEEHVCNIRKDIVAACNIQKNNTADLHKAINKAVSFTLTNTIDEIHKCINGLEKRKKEKINEYIAKYNTIQNIFKVKGIGGDTKLSNFGFKIDTEKKENEENEENEEKKEKEIIVFDTILPSSNPYLPLDWDSWYNNERKKNSRKNSWKSNDEYDKFMLLFTNPIIRLLYKGCTKYPGITGGKRYTKKKITKKTRTFTRK